MPKTGPKTREGRTKSAQNALKHGLTSASMFVLDNESQAEWESLLNTWIAKLEPADEAELAVVTDIAHAQWRLRRCRTYETEILNEQLSGGKNSGAAFKSLADKSKSLDLLHRYETRHRRAVDRGLATLEKLRAMTASLRPETIEVMWVDDTPETAPPEDPQPAENAPPAPRIQILPNEIPEPAEDPRPRRLKPIDKIPAAMKRREFLATIAAAPMLRAADPRPNIVYILADDLGWGDLVCYNPESKVPTPNANKLASQGVRFTDMHSGSAVCTPTRYGIMTGRYAWRSRLKEGVLWGYSPNLIEPGRTTVPSLLKKAGYRTAGIGKWHLGLGTDEKVDYSKRFKPGPNEHGFDYYFGIPASLDMEPYVYIENDRTVEQPTATTPGRNEPRGVFWRPGPIAPSLKIEDVLPTLESKAVSYIRERARTPGTPFFLYFPLTGPHTPWVPKPKYKGKSGAGIYGDFAVQVDDTLGAIMKVLEETGLASNTLLVFTSDNGAHWTPDDKQKYPHRANAGWRGMKADIHEAGHRIPFLVRWPGKAKPGTVNNDTACLVDLMATVADIVGTKLPANAGEDSFSLLPALTGGKGKREAVVHHSSLGMFAIRQGEWKLAFGKGSGGFSNPKTLPGPGGQLFNIAADPGETSDLYDKHPEIVKRLTALLDKYKREGRSRPI